MYGSYLRMWAIFIRRDFMENKVELKEQFHEIGKKLHQLSSEKDTVLRTISKLKAKSNYLDDEIEKLNKEALLLVDELRK
jgi:predicted nuclease with TOPRIM domain